MLYRRGAVLVPCVGRLRYAASPLALVDLVAIAPFYVALFGWSSALDLRLLRTLRLLAQVARLSRYSSGIQTLARVLHDKGSQLLTVIMVLGVLLLIAASLMFFAEHRAQPEKFASIPQSMWWSVITLTTVGYGDAVPVTVPGRMLAGLIAVLGIGLLRPAGRYPRLRLRPRAAQGRRPAHHLSPLWRRGSARQRGTAGPPLIGTRAAILGRE